MNLENENIDLEKSFRKFNEPDETEVQERRMEEKHSELFTADKAKELTKKYSKSFEDVLKNIYIMAENGNNYCTLRRQHILSGVAERIEALGYSVKVDEVYISITW